MEPITGEVVKEPRTRSRPGVETPWRRRNWPSNGRRGERGADTHAPRLLGGHVDPWGPDAPPLNWPSNGHQLTERRALGKGTPESPPLHKETYSVGLFFHRASARAQ